MIKTNIYKKKNNMKYIKLFNTTTEYEAFKNGEDWALPNLSLIEDTYEVKMTP